MKPFLHALTAILLLIVLACQQESPKGTSGKSDLTKQEKYAKKEPSVSPFSSYAVLYTADTLKLNRIKKSIGEDNFYTAADDNMWYAAQAREFFEKKKIKVVETQEEHILLKGKDGKSIQIRIAEDAWTALYLFDGVHPPASVDITAIEDEYQTFLRKKN